MRKTNHLLLEIDYIYPTACCTSLPTKSLNTGISLIKILILSVASLLSTVAPPSCCECYQFFHCGGKMQQSFTYHTHIEKSCYGNLIEEGFQSGKGYCKVKNPGVSSSRNEAICSKGWQWLCFTKIGQWGVNTQVLEDIKREQIIAKAKATIPSTQNHPWYFDPFIQNYKQMYPFPSQEKTVCRSRRKHRTYHECVQLLGMRGSLYE
ncbi:LOW QUALITY PROTEIN: suppressyn-like [Trachypithecus francoisi]|uniref:LOW QUALITY PROTEIN: suppressyn-like n=1 Tax=Trachypithecus francoisi TaxID=54180 RepID=UPI00141B45EE|nr:LOW QUALITY PROTEIN: suppressyn-like [Trachypithecus francoisi]